MNGAIADRGFSAAQRELRIYGGTITQISAPPVHDGNVNGNSTPRSLTFQSTGSGVLLVWSGHLPAPATGTRAAARSTGPGSSAALPGTCAR